MQISGILEVKHIQTLKSMWKMAGSYLRSEWSLCIKDESMALNIAPVKEQSLLYGSLRRVFSCSLPD